MAASILHRASGDGLAIVGAAVLLWWLGAAASGAEAYASFIECAASIPGQVVLIGLTWAFFQHAGSGLRHLLLDTGAGYELKSNRSWSMLVLVFGALATAAFWLFIYFGRL